MNGNDVDGKATQFDEAWRTGVPRLEDYLPAVGSPARLEALVRLASIDLERRLAAGEDARVERLYLEPYSELRADRAAAVGLIVREWELRRGRDEGVSLDDFLARFAECRDELVARLGASGTDHTVWPDTVAPSSNAPGQRTPHAPPSPTPLDPPKTAVRPAEPLPNIPGYELIEKISSGGMGILFRARDPELQRDVVIKMMHPNLRNHRDFGDFRSRFVAEAQLGGQLQHPNILPVYSLGWLPDGLPFLTMKLIKGRRSLADVLAKKERELEWYLGVFEGVCQALAYAHNRHVIHRDLKPANVMIGDFGEVQVIDWGLGKTLGQLEPEAPEPGTRIKTTRSEGGDEAMLDTGAAGTIEYAAPEQARGETHLVDERADVFGLGAILCEILTGRPPFVGANRYAVLGLAQAGDVSGAVARLDGCGKDAPLVALCKACLAANRDERPRRAGELAERVKGYREELQRRLRQAELEQAAAAAREQEARATAEAQRRAATAERNRRRLTGVLAAVVLLAVCVGGAVAWWLHDQRQELRSKVRADLSDARTLLRNARDGEPEKLGEALKAAQTAGERARLVWVSEGLRHQAEALEEEVREEVRLAERDRVLLARVADVGWPVEIPEIQRDANGVFRSRLSGPVSPHDAQGKGKRSSGSQAIALGPSESPRGASRPDPDSEFAEAFRDWGLNLEDEAIPAAKAVAPILLRPQHVRLSIAATLEERAFERCRRGEPGSRWRRLLDLAEQLDESGDEQTKKLRLILRNDRLRAERVAAVVSLAMLPRGAAWAGVVPGEDRNALRGMVRTREQIAQVAKGPVLRTLTLARALMIAGDGNLAFRLLRAACHEHPREAILYQTIGNQYAAQSPPQWANAAVYYLTARALQPGLGVSLAHALRESNRVEEGLTLLRTQAEQSPNNPWLSWTCGVAHEHAPKPFTNYAEALRWYRAGAERGHARSQNSLARMYDYGRGVPADVAEALRLYRLAAKQNDVDGQSNVGRMYAEGRGVAKDDRVALEWYRKAADQGNAVAQNSYGLMHHRGHGVAQDDVEAVKWYRRSAEQGHDWAQYNLGVMYANGWGLARDIGEAIRWYRISAEQGHAWSEYNLGWIYENGRGVAQEYKLAAYWYRKGADHGHSSAQNNLGRMYQRGRGVEKNDSEAVKLYRKAADQDNAVAQNNLGAMYESGLGVAQDHKEAARWYRKAADQEDPDGQNNLGLMYENGWGVAQNHKEAVRWYRQAADQGHAAAQSNYGLMFHRGRGVAQDDAEAVRWYRKAAEQGYDWGEYNLGVMYENGWGVAQDHEEAVRWYRQAADRGLADAQNNLGWMYRNGWGLPQDDQLALKWYRQAADKGLALAQSNLGRMYEKGRGVNRDLKEAIRWYRLAADQGNPSGQTDLGAMYESGLGVAQDHKEAARWYRKAADQGDPDGQNNLGLMYENGWGVAQDHKEAVRWYGKAADQGHASGQNNIGWLHENGWGVNRDYKEAARWYRKAAENGNVKAQNNLGTLYAEGCGVPYDDKEAFRWYSKAAAQDDDVGQNNVGLAYLNGHGTPKDARKAIDWFRKAAQGGNAEAAANLVSALEEVGELSDSVKAWSRTLADEPRNHTVRFLRATALTVQAHFAEGQRGWRACLRAIPKGHPLREPAETLAKECDRLLALDGKLPDVLGGKNKPADADEQLQFAKLCNTYKKRHATAARFYAAAFKAEPKLATENRYDAACSAVLAAAGKGTDAAKLDGAERSRLRNQALTWLQADLTALLKKSKKKIEDERDVRRTLRNWREDPDLAFLRDKEALDKLPEAERPAWRKLWADVAERLAEPSK